MFKPHKNICSSCGNDAIVVVKKMLCAKCNHEQKQAKKKSAGKKPSKSFQSYSFKEPTGEAQVFEKISEERPWICYVCEKQLYELTASNFLHVLPKALNKFPKMKTYDKNIVLGCHDSESSCHHRWDKSPRSSLTEPMWDKMKALEQELKNEYKQLYGK